MQQSTQIKSGLFWYLLSLTLLFMCTELSFFIQSSQVYLGEFGYVSRHLQIPYVVIPGILFFIFAQLFIHFTFTVMIWLLARLNGHALNLSWQQTQKVGLSLWVIGLVTVLLANEYYFPFSKFAEITKLLIPYSILPVCLTFVSGLFFASVILAVFTIFRFALRKRWLSLFLLISSSLLSLLVFAHRQHPVTSPATALKPNIILIGVDSLRPDFLGYFGSLQPTPAMDKFLNHATVFADAITPLARTFPAWVSILTGEYPKKNGVRFNLAEQKELDLTETLPAILRQHGYETIFAMDETRFSNIDTNFGFDEIITPPIGFNDFLLGTMNDFPLSNLLINSWIGHKLFINSYANRAVYYTYEPDSFINLLKPALEKPRTKPLFLVVHFCLPHFPYFWSSFHTQSTYALRHYQASVMRVDTQVQDFLRLLQQNNLLQHSMVVLLSDHGEAVELHGDRVTDAALFIPGTNNPNKTLPHFYPPSFDFETIDQSAGHGTDVLGLSQYHSLLSFRFYGLGKQTNKNIAGIVSLMDIKPTILDLLHIQYKKVSGKSLVELINGTKKTVPVDDFFIESDFSPEAVRSVHPETRRLLFEGIDFFQINPETMRLTVKPSMANLIITSKQYADLYGSWILALYPQNKKPMTPILVNLLTGHWTDDLNTDFAKKSPAQHMLKALKNFYGSELKIM